MNREKIHGFELMLWRLCRGNVFLKTAEIPEAIEDAQTVKNYKTKILIIEQLKMLKIRQAYQK